MDQRQVRFPRDVRKTGSGVAAQGPGEVKGSKAGKNISHQGVWVMRKQ